MTETELAAPYRILVVDDDAHIVTLVSRMLKRMGYEVITARNGEEGWAKVQESQPDLAILDVMMPVSDGYQLCRKIKSDKDLFRTYIIMLTAKDQKEDIVTGLRSGADDYIPKPFHHDELFARIEAGLRHGAIQRELIQIEKDKGLGRVVGGISHLFNNLLTGIRGHLELAQERNNADFTRSAFHTAIHNIDACALIIRNLSYYSGKAYLRRLDNVLFDELLKGLLDLYRPQLELNSIELHHEVESVPEVQIDPGAVSDIMANLLSNSMQAMPRGGIVTVRLKKVEDKIILEVEDNGIGIPADQVHNIFDPFFTTKASRPVVDSAGRGLSGKDVPGHGLGLSVVQGIVQAHGGSIQVHSEEEKGTKFILTFFMEAAKPAYGSETLP